MSAKSPLGRRSSYLASYSPDVLHAIPRDENRRLLGLTAELPFQGEDLWNAYELTNARTRKRAQGHRWHTALKARFAATAGNVGMPVDKPGYQPASSDIGDNCMRGGNRLYVLADRKNAPTTDGQVADT